MPLTKDDIENIFTYHEPKPEQVDAYLDIRERAKRLALTINDFCPDSREKSLAITNLQQVVMWANAAIAIYS